MFKNLLLIRHAKAFDNEPGQRDFDRELTPDGVKDASKIGKFLHEKGLRPDLILSSPAIRAKDTAELVAEQLHYNKANIQYDEDLFEASVRIFLRTINALDDQYNTVFLLGHNPTIAHFSEYIANEEVSSVKNSGVVHLQFELESWNLVSQNSGTIAGYYHPDSIN